MEELRRREGAVRTAPPGHEHTTVAQSRSGVRGSRDDRRRADRHYAGCRIDDFGRRDGTARVLAADDDDLSVRKLGRGMPAPFDVELRLRDDLRERRRKNRQRGGTRERRAHAETRLHSSSFPRLRAARAMKDDEVGTALDGSGRDRAAERKIFWRPSIGRRLVNVARAAFTSGGSREQASCRHFRDDNYAGFCGVAVSLHPQKLAFGRDLLRPVPIHGAAVGGEALRLTDFSVDHCSAAARARKKPKRYSATRRIWISSEPSVMR